MLFGVREQFTLPGAWYLSLWGSLSRLPMNWQAKSLPHVSGKAFGLVTSLGALGVALGQLTGGYIAACLELQTPFVLMAALMALAAVTVAWRIEPVQQ